jgi:centrosomal protein CEP135
MIVRRQLDELGYKQSLKIDGLPLAEQLLADLIHTTESLRRYKDLAQQALEVRIP